MPPRALFAVQFLWFLAAWSAVVWLLIRPRLDALPERQALSLWIAPQMFRVLGLGLAVENLSPGMPRHFAVPTAIGDSLTAVLALCAFVALRRGAGIGRALAWACTVVGSVDLAIASVPAARANAADHLHGQWYVPALGVPLMIVMHAMRGALCSAARRPELRRPRG